MDLIQQKEIMLEIYYKSGIKTAIQKSAAQYFRS